MISKITVTDYIKNLLKKLIYGERSAHKLALSFAIGIYIAFSPYIGFHNIMVFLFSWLLGLNTLTTFAVAHINNPLTTIPVLASCYKFGDWIVKSLCGITFKFTNPEWINFLNGKLTYYLGVPKICFWTFFIGANILGLLLAFLFYPLMKYVFDKLINEHNFNNV